MKHCIIFIGVLILISNSCFSQIENQSINNSTSVSTYNDHSINIIFKGSIDIIKNNNDENKEYFFRSIEIIRFNENEKIINSNSQHLVSEFEINLDSTDLQVDTTHKSLTDYLNIDNSDTLPPIDHQISKTETYSSLSNSFSYYQHLSTLYIMPKMSKKALNEEVESYINKDSLFQISGKIESIKIGKKKVLKWRAQNGKTRLDHYVVFGKEYNYLFVSSPYGTNGIIESIILEMEILKKRNTTKIKRH
ncbi:MAG: hypothetical protein ACI8ZM_004764 [Crocinitomix sp.]|jgi:hypothetical protein